MPKPKTRSLAGLRLPPSAHAAEPITPKIMRHADHFDTEIGGQKLVDFESTESVNDYMKHKAGLGGGLSALGDMAKTQSRKKRYTRL